MSNNFRGKIYNSITETIGNTPLVRFTTFAKECGVRAEIIGKCEFFNPLSSVKDRIGLAMIEDAENAGRINKDTIIIEPTSGNTGIALAAVCAAKGYKIILTMPESMSIERRKMLAHLGAELVLTPAANGMKGAISKAEELLTEHPNSFMPSQFDNPANPEIHKKTTAIEIIEDTKGKIDVFIAGVGTGGTLSGTAEILKKHNPDIKIIAVEPESSPVISGGNPGPHKIQGIGAGFIPKNLDTTLIDETVQISNDKAFETARLVAKTEGTPVGISSGAALAAAIKVASRPEMDGKRIVVILPSFAERYLSTELFA